MKHKIKVVDVGGKKAIQATVTVAEVRRDLVSLRQRLHELASRRDAMSKAIQDLAPDEANLVAVLRELGETV